VYYPSAALRAGFAGAQRIAMRVLTSSSDTLYYLHSDHLGSTSLTTNATGGWVGEMKYLPYGSPRPGYPTGSVPTDRRFTGQRSEEATLGSLYDYGARFYSPAVGRFVSADTMVPDLSNPQDLNRYAYVRNNPLRFNDPSGHFLECALAGPAAPLCVVINWIVIEVGVAVVGATAITISGDPTLGPRPFDAPLPLPPPETDLPLKVVTTALAATVKAVTDAAVDAAKQKENEGKNADKELGSTLKPGPHAGESIPARGPKVRLTGDEQSEIDRIGSETGCHTCGTKDPGTKSGHFVGDHQPPSRLNPYNEPQRIYPHCLNCSRTQGGEVREAIRRGLMIK